MSAGRGEQLSDLLPVDLRTPVRQPAFPLSRNPQGNPPPRPLPTRGEDLTHSPTLAPPEPIGG